jgi:hypothetical protein
MNRQTAPHDALDLYLYALNDYALYQQQRKHIEANLQRLFDNGNYNSDKATKLWGYFANNAAKKYHIDKGLAWFHLFSTDTRRAVATLCEAEHYDLMKERKD